MEHLQSGARNALIMFKRVPGVPELTITGSCNNCNILGSWNSCKRGLWNAGRVSSHRLDSKHFFFQIQVLESLYFPFFIYNFGTFSFIFFFESPKMRETNSGENATPKSMAVQFFRFNLNETKKNYENDHKKKWNNQL